MTDKYKVVSTKNVRPGTRKSPMHHILENVDGDFWLLKDVAAHIGVHQETIRRLIKRTDADGNRLVEAPSNAVKAGDVVMYLFNMPDVVEIEEHYGRFGYNFDRVNQKKPLQEQKPSA